MGFRMTDDEFMFDAERFSAALREQREMQLRGGLYHLNQIAMAYNSNRIEGSRLSEDQTRHLYETRSISGDALVDDVVETTNHFRAFDLMIDRVGKPVTSEHIKELHRILKSGTSDSQKEWFAVGEWKRVPNVVGNTQTTQPSEVEGAIADLLGNVPRPMDFEDICDFHVKFETIHPFQDGNGRVGRLLMFGQCLSNGIMPFIVSDRDKAFYYRGLDQYSEEPGFLRDTFRSFQDSYLASFRDYLPALPPSQSQGWPGPSGGVPSAEAPSQGRGPKM